MKKKIIYIVIIAMIASILNINTVKASESVVQDVASFQNGVMNGYSKLLRYAGMIIDTGIEVNRQSISFVKQQLIKLSLLSSGASDQDVEDFFNNNITVGPHSSGGGSHSGRDVSYTPDMNIYIKNEEQEIINTYGFYYVYSFDILQNTTAFPSGDLYNAVKNMCTQYQNEYYIFFHAGSESIVLCPINSYGLVLNNDINNYLAYANLYNYSSWNMYNFSDNIWTYNSSSKEFVKTGSWGYDHRGQVSKIDNQTLNIGNGVFLVTYNGCHTYKMYRTLNDLKSDSVGQSPYYISDSYNTFQSTSGSYNTTTTDNSVTYGDITNYINSFNQQNGINPTPNEIKVYITVTNGSGGGSGGDSGGSGGDSGDLGIFDFLSRIGKVLGNLIKNLGNVLAELVEGLAETVNSLFESIPTVFNTFMQGVFSWLPTELLSIITLGIAAMILVGIIKIFKG